MTALTSHDEITIRHAGPADAPALRRLAALDSAPVPDGALLVAEVGGAVRAALSLPTGDHIAAPALARGELVELLAALAKSIRRAPAGRGERIRGRLALRTALGRRSAAARTSA